MNRSVYLGLSTRELSKTLTNEFCYDYVNPKYGEKARLCDIDTYSFSVYIKTNDLYKQIAQNAESRLDVSNYELVRQLPKGKSKKVNWLMKDELGAKIMTKFAGLRAKIHSYLTDNGTEDKRKQKSQKIMS